MPDLVQKKRKLYLREKLEMKFVFFSVEFKENGLYCDFFHSMNHFLF